MNILNAMRHGRLCAALLAATGLSACMGGDGGSLAGGDRPASAVSRDVEVPEVFQVTEEGLWDGRPSLGGVWVAHPDVDEPERVIIRNQGNGDFVIGALFRREAQNPGPALQISSDAAEALGVLAGTPTVLDVTALRREDRAGATDTDDMAKPVAPEADTVAVAPIDTPEPVADLPAPTSTLDKPFIQIGIFSVEQNALNTADALREVGVVPAVETLTTAGKTFHRVIVGPARSAEDRAAALTKVQALGFADAYFVSG